MYSQIQPLITGLQAYFDNVSLTDDKALQKPNNAVIFIDRVVPEYLTSSRIRKTCEMAIMFSIDGTADTAYQTADTKIADIESVLESSFNYYEIQEIQFGYVNNLHRLFVFAQFTIQWEE
ncbi:hypothetical protein [Thermosipho globiformans]|uniref:hypothetical protein n=1 Tax=Thermosipho globiformans TaxID=380685 RepID=UPI000F8DEB66|nr:hypothetical protein [Thermosipho globiformans]